MILWVDVVVALAPSTSSVHREEEKSPSFSDRSSH